MSKQPPSPHRDALAEALQDENLLAVAQRSTNRWDGLREWHACLRKRPHPSETAASAAVRASRRRTGTQLVAYCCPFDSAHWHVGHPGTSGDDRKQKKNIHRSLLQQRRQGTIQIRGYRLEVRDVYLLLPFLAPLQGPAREGSGGSL